jgi:hypothetical protein
LDVLKVFGLLRRFFDPAGEPFVVVGGLAMLTYGATRNTCDCDLLVRSGVRPGLLAFLEAAGYETREQTAAFSNHLHRGDIDLGRLDILYVDDDTAEQVFAASRSTSLGRRSRLRFPVPTI